MSWKGSNMAKFYVSSKNVRLVVQAADAEGAALWAIHQVIEQKLESTSQIIDGQRITAAFADWDKTISVSEQGFERFEAGSFITEDTVQHYVELIVALERIVTQHSIDKG